MNTSLRSFGTFARADREFTDTELVGLADDMRALHESLMPPENLTEAELEALRLLKAGLLMKEVAHELGITESAVKQRLKNAKTKLSARTTTQAVLQVTQLGWIK
jgi:LuxR family transcriptional regulator